VINDEKPVENKDPKEIKTEPKTESKTELKVEAKPGARSFSDRNQRSSRDSHSQKRPFGDSGDGFEEIVIKINRCCKVVKGGKRFSFAALVAVGDRKTHVGFGKGKAKEVPFAVKKAVKDAKKNLVSVPMKDTTIPHTVSAKYCASRVIIRPACRGTGIIAGSTVKAILELAGVKDVLSKIMGSTNPNNVVKATVLALNQLKSMADRNKLLQAKV